MTAVFTLTLWLRRVGATGSGWLADRIGRKKPLMISIAWFSVCHFIAALLLSPEMRGKEMVAELTVA